jgi:hypothetical protein
MTGNISSYFIKNSAELIFQIWYIYLYLDIIAEQDVRRKSYEPF